MAPFLICLHPDEVAIGAALIVAAAGAVQRPGGGVAAAWGLYPLYQAERGMAAMCQAAAAHLRCPCRCFAFQADPQLVTLGPVPPPVRWPKGGGRSFDPTLSRLATEVGGGALGLLMDDGWGTASDPRTKVSFRPGILHLCPSYPGDSPTGVGDAFVEAGFPTLIVSAEVPLRRWSAHEVLDLSAQLVETMTKALGTPL